MPKILIDEIDRTSPGAAEPYANYTVLIAGLEAQSFRFEDDFGQVESAKLTGRLPLYRKEPVRDEQGNKTGEDICVYNRPVKPDDNGVYEFNSAEDFEKTIGLVPPEYITTLTDYKHKWEITEVQSGTGRNATTSRVLTLRVTPADEKVSIYHYGNQMAYELLRMGYPIIYKSLNPTEHLDPTYKEATTKEKPTESAANNLTGEIWPKVTTDIAKSINEMSTESFWEIFKDKASYDFRFISHGLLKTSDIVNDTAFGKASSDVLKNLRERRDELVKANNYLEDILTTAENSLKTDPPTEGTSNETELANRKEQIYSERVFGKYVTVKETVLEEQEDGSSKEVEKETSEFVNGDLADKDGFYTYLTADADTGELKNPIIIYKNEDVVTDNPPTQNYLIKSDDKFLDFLINFKSTKYASYNAAKAGIEAELKLLDYNCDKFTEETPDFDRAMAISTWEAQQNQVTLQCLTRAKFNDTNGQIAALAKYADADTDQPGPGELPGRGDCTALIELDERSYMKSASTDKPEILIIDAINSLDAVSGDAIKGKFCALTVPSIVYKMTEKLAFGNNRKFPGAFHYLACFINSLKLGFAEWYAAAGYTRGVSGLTVDYTTVKLGETAINVLEPRNYKDDPNYTHPNFACNVIANFRGSYYLWGNRTCHAIGREGDAKNGDLVASHFLNIRQLCTTIKKQLYVSCRRFTFDPNSDTLWFNFVNAIKPTLEAMKADQGIRDYKIVKVFTDKKATLKAKIRIIPIEAVEDFDLEISLEDSFGETTAVVTE